MRVAQENFNIVNNMTLNELKNDLDEGNKYYGKNDSKELLVCRYLAIYADEYLDKFESGYRKDDLINIYKELSGKSINGCKEYIMEQIIEYMIKNNQI